MKVVIDIPENDYWLACNHPDALISIYAHYIKKGIPLPEKHGRLVDVDEISATMLDRLDQTTFEYALSTAPTIVEAEGAEGE
jgi:hypothetical protein